MTLAPPRPPWLCPFPHGWFYDRLGGYNIPEPRVAWPIQIDLNTRSIGVDLIFLKQDRPELFDRIDWPRLNRALEQLATRKPRFPAPFVGRLGDGSWTYAMFELRQRSEVWRVKEQAVAVLAEAIGRAA